MIIREQNGMASLLREHRSRIRAEIEGTTRRHLSTFSESDESMRNEDMSTDGTHERIQLILQSLCFHLHRKQWPMCDRFQSGIPNFHSQHWR